MKRPLTLAEMRAEGRDPLSVVGIDRALLVDAAWLARTLGGAPLMFWDDEDEDDRGPGYAHADGVAVVAVDGPLMQRGWMCADGYDTACADLEAALADPSVRTVLLRINSPGGAAAGAFEWTGRMRELVVASGKRCVAYADEMACSGAYAIACVADEIVTPETGVVGSVGVIASMVSWARANEAEGIDFRAITSGAEKADGCPNLPLDEAAVARAQREVDTIAGVFHRWVAARRRMTPEAVRALEAGVRMGTEAVAAGLADRVLGYHALLAELRAAASAAPLRAPVSPTGARRAASTRHPMNEETLAAVCAATGETDPDKAVTALLTRAKDAGASVEKLSGDLAAARATIDGLSTDLAASREAERAAAAKVEGIEREAELTAAKAAGQWSASLEGFLATLSVPQLRTWRASAPRVVPQGEIKAPAEAPRADAELPVDIAALVAKASRDGWKSLTAAERHAVTTHDKALAARLRKGV